MFFLKHATESSFLISIGIRMPESGKFFHVESGIREDFACGIRNPGRDFAIRNSAQGIRSTT